MKVLFVHDHEVNPFKGGMQRVSYLIAEELARRGHEPLFLSLRDDPQSFSGKGTIPQFTLSLHKLKEKGLKEELERFVRENNIDFIALQHPEKPYRGALVDLSKLARTVFFLHNQPYPPIGKERIVKKRTPSSGLKRKGKVLRILGIVAPPVFRKLYLKSFGSDFKRIVDSVDRFVLLSDRYSERFLKYTPQIDASKVISINNPITFPLEESSADIDNKENVVLTVCRITSPQKNLTDFIDVWKKFSKLKPDWKAIVVGDGESRDFIEKYARKKGVRNIQFEGNRENVADYYKRAKIFCMTSCYEGWPMVLMESMAFGCVPVVYDSFEAVHDMITDGKDGIIVEAFNKDRMVEAMLELADNPARYKEMVEAAPQKLRLFTIDKIVDEWESKIL